MQTSAITPKHPAGSIVTDLDDPAPAIAAYVEIYTGNLLAGRKHDYAERRARKRVGRDLHELAGQQRRLWHERLDGLRSPDTGLLVGLDRIALRLLGDPTMMLAIGHGWTANDLFGVNLTNPDKPKELSFLTLCVFHFDAVIPPNPIWHFGHVEYDYPDGGRRHITTSTGPPRVPIWEHPLFAAPVN